MTTNWKTLFEELLLAVEDARREFDDLDATRLEFEGKAAKVVDPDEVGGDYYVELWEARELFDDLLEDWRRRLYVAELEDARGAVAA